MVLSTVSLVVSSNDEEVDDEEEEEGEDDDDEVAGAFAAAMELRCCTKPSLPRVRGSEDIVMYPARRMITTAITSVN